MIFKNNYFYKNQKLLNTKKEIKKSGLGELEIRKITKKYTQVNFKKYVYKNPKNYVLIRKKTFL